MSAPRPHQQTASWVRGSPPLILLLVRSTLPSLQPALGCFSPRVAPPPCSALFQFGPRSACHHLSGAAGKRARARDHPESRRTPPPLCFVRWASSSGDLRNTSGRLLLILNISPSSWSAANQLPHVSLAQHVDMRWVMPAEGLQERQVAPGHSTDEDCQAPQPAAGFRWVGEDISSPHGYGLSTSPA